ncbi:acyl carrier protein [Streptomyces sp. NPDC029674]|uniref:acyl carrier protein n=1 Tax=Streptomyces sp. NPDC029674 TaxID=3365297 RepID=UPI0038506DBA
MPDIVATIHRVLTDDFEVPAEAIHPQATLESLDLDSLALAEFSLILQERLGVKPAVGIVAKTTTVSRLAASLAAGRDAGSTA